MTHSPTRVRTTLLLAATALAAGLSACSPYHQTKEVTQFLGTANVAGTPFTAALTQQYQIYVRGEQEVQRDYSDATHFARKGLAAAQGLAVMPEDVAQWNIEYNYLSELNRSHDRLVAAYERGARTIQPQLSAVAQVAFDCWVEDQEDMKAKPTAAPCKAQFMDAMQRLDAAVPMVAVVAPVPAVPVAPVMAVPPMAEKKAVNENEGAFIFFDFNKSDIKPESFTVLEEVARAVKEKRSFSVRLIGHADSHGDNKLNDALSQRRALQVQTVLIGMGVPAGLISYESRGEHDQLVPTPDQTEEKRNRRVQIIY